MFLYEFLFKLNILYGGIRHGKIAHHPWVHFFSLYCILSIYLINMFWCIFWNFIKRCGKIALCPIYLITHFCVFVFFFFLIFLHILFGVKMCGKNISPCSHIFPTLFYSLPIFFYNIFVRFVAI